jgi:hypothetical protein
MKKIFLSILALYGLHTAAQVKIGNNPATVNADALLELEASNKGLLYPRVALTATTNAAPLNAHVQGMTVYNTATTSDVTPGLYTNDGTKWAPLGIGAAPASTVTAVCNGFTGTYTAGAATRTFTVTYTNNSFNAAAFTPVVGDLVLSPASGLTVASVTPNSAQSLASGASLLVTYNLGGSLSATPGTVITGTFTKLGLSCSKTVAVANVVPTVNTGSAQQIVLDFTNSVNLSGSASDADGTIVSYAWTKTGGTGAATPVITSPSSAATTVTGINAVGTYIFTLTATDNSGATGTANVTITANNMPTATVGGPGGTTLQFMSHNLGADYSLDPLTPVQGVHGNYYQFGRSAAVATAATSGAIAGWNTTAAPMNAWNSGTEAAPVKTATDPCPAGYRVPTALEFAALINAANGNTVSYVGSFTDSASNYTSGMLISHASSLKLLFPSAGFRHNSDGSLRTRGISGYYSTSRATSATSIDKLGFYGANSHTMTNGPINHGQTIKCIKI